MNKRNGGHVFIREIKVEDLEAIVCDDKPVGMCNLRDNDGIRSDLGPWLGSLVVHPDYQREGIALKLINAIKQKAKQLGFN